MRHPVYTTGNRGLVTALAVAAAIQPWLATANADKSPPLRYRGDTVANALPGGCYGPVGFYVGLDAQVSAKSNSSDVARAAKRNRPTRARLRLGGRWYSLRIDAKLSGTAANRIWWSFRRVKASQAATRRAIGRPAYVQYSIGKRTLRTKAARARDGDCM